MLEANLHRSNRVLFSLGYKAYCDSRHVTMAAVGEEEGKEEQMGVTKVLILMQGPRSLSPFPLRSPVLRGVFSHYCTDVNSIQFNRSF